MGNKTMQLIQQLLAVLHICQGKRSPTVQLVGFTLSPLVVQENAVLFLLQHHCLREKEKKKDSRPSHPSLSMHARLFNFVKQYSRRIF